MSADDGEFELGEETELELNDPKTGDLSLEDNLDDDSDDDDGAMDADADDSSLDPEEVKPDSMRCSVYMTNLKRRLKIRPWQQASQSC